MAVLEKEISKRFPQWFEGRKSAFSKSLVSGYSRFCRFSEIERFIAEHSHLRGQMFIGQALDYLNIRYSVDHVEKANIPAKGRCIIVANHPAGVIDALALLHFIGGIRSDVKILANEVLASLNVLDDLIIPIDVFGAKNRKSSMDSVHEALQSGQCVIIFPAGEVSRLRPNGIKDAAWRAGFLRMAAQNDAPVIPVRITARNSALFYSMSTIYKPLGTLLLPREITARRNSRFDLRIGKPLTVNPKMPMQPSLKAIRQSLYAIGTRSQALSSELVPVIPALDRMLLKQEIRKLEKLGETPDGKFIMAGRISPHSPLLQELGRLRELSFRAVGEGTGKRADIDKYDAWYEHIILWNQEELEIIGAYRVADGQTVYAEHGLEGFYTSSLFRYSCAVLPRLAEGVELGRSFIVPEYWNTRSLDHLWCGIGAYLARKPHVRYLYGPVSLSAAMPVAARERIVAYYQRFHGCTQGRAQAFRPFRFLGEMQNGPCQEQAMLELRAALDAQGVRIPTLYKQYTELCEPGGAVFLAFGVDPAFNNAVDGLIEVDVSRMKPMKRRRYLENPGTRNPALS